MNDTTSPNETAALEKIKSNLFIVSAVLYTVICVLGVLGNGLVIYVTGFKMKKTVNSVWFLNLSLADFLFSTFLIILAVNISQHYKWIFGAVMCKLTYFVSSLSMFASVFFLMAISLDRFLSIWAAVWAHNKRTPRKAKLVAFMIWVAAIVSSIPFATFRQIRNRDDHYVCSYKLGTPFWALTNFRFTAGFLLPFLVICVCNVAIHIRTRRLQRRRKAKSQRIIFSIIFAFFICWLPLHVVHFFELHPMFVNRYKVILLQIAAIPCVCLAFLNSCLNPILYVLMCDDFQKKLKQSICFVLESALAEDQVSTTTRSMSTPNAWTSGRSGSVVPTETDLSCKPSQALRTEG